MQKILLGAHTSAAGGVHMALYQGRDIGATTIQLFTSNQKQWNGRKLGTEEIALWEKALAETGITDVMSHDSYLINLGAANLEILAKSRKAFRDEIERCHALKIPYLNFHPGAYTTSSEEECLETIVQSLLGVEDLVQKGTTKLLLETTAGQGTSVGHRFEHLGIIIERVKDKIPIGVCIDTCHLFVAGYDIRTEEGWRKTLQEFEAKIGLKHLSAFHVNDSAKDFGSRVDRHADIGQGKIGFEAFRFLMQYTDLPKYLETPSGPPSWKNEIAMLRKYAEEKDQRAS